MVVLLPDNIKDCFPWFQGKISALAILFINMLTKNPNGKLNMH